MYLEFFPILLSLQVSVQLIILTSRYINCQATPTPTQSYPMAEEYNEILLKILKRETMELLEKRVDMWIDKRRCQVSWPVAITKCMFT